MRSLTTECVLLLQNVFSYYRLCSLTMAGASQQQRAGGKHAVYYALSVIISLDSMNGGAPSLSGNRGLPGDGGGGGTGDGGGGDTQAQVSYFINRRFSRFVALHGYCFFLFSCFAGVRVRVRACLARAHTHALCLSRARTLSLPVATNLSLCSYTER